jgi:NADPH-dependent glutamate synthase beta subunit-like oxidoreductase
MPMNLSSLSEARHVVGICGGAVGGSEAAALVAKAGSIAVVFEQNIRPYGKIEDGLPRWHSKLRSKEYAKIDENLSTPGVVFVPGTQLGKDLSFSTLSNGIGLSALILAHGAWRDRSLPIKGVDRFVGNGLSYQNPFVYWFNHYEESGFAGEDFPIHDDAIVIGGGLASIDVCKILNLELYARALGDRGIAVDIEQMEVRGIPRTLEAHGLTQNDFKIRGCTLFYRRGKEDMPLENIKNPTAQRIEKLKGTRVKIMDKVIRKYLVRFQPNAVPAEVIEKNGALNGFVFQRTEIVGGRVLRLENTEFEAHSKQVISSIGSTPVPIDGVPMKGELYQWQNKEEGRLVEGVYGLGNVLTGKGNIVESRRNSKQITPNVIEQVLTSPKIPADGISEIMKLIQARWDAVGYGGRYADWITAKRPAT